VLDADGSVSQITTIYNYEEHYAQASGGWLCSDSFRFRMRALHILELATMAKAFRASE
jgi:hypothetical protein